jgi:hypothetical protein
MAERVCADTWRNIRHDLRQTDPRFGHQSGQLGDEVQRLEDHERRAVPKALTTLAASFRGMVSSTGLLHNAVIHIRRD